MNINNLTKIGRGKGASDIHISAGLPLMLRVDGKLTPIKNRIISRNNIEDLVYDILSKEDVGRLKSQGDIDLSFSDARGDRYRANIFKQKGNYSIALRIIPSKIPTIDSLKLPNIFKELASLEQGLVLVTGPSGSGKSTSLAAMVDYINRNRNCHILTLEDPIEYIHQSNKSLINQREIGRDSKNFSSALRSSLRQDPDVILVGEMRDLETISTVLTAAETGHLVISSLHTAGAARTINRIIDVFPSDQQAQIRKQLAQVVRAVLSQLLIPRKDKQGSVAAFEIMLANQAIKNLIRENKIYQINNIIETGSRFGMQDFHKDLRRLYIEGIINKQEKIRIDN